MTAPTTVFVNLLLDSDGNPRGFEKARDGRFHAEEDAARFANCGNYQYRTVECVVMSRAEYDALVTAERERCAKLCDAEAAACGGVAAGPLATEFGKLVHEAMAAGAMNCAASIRTDGNKEDL